jgi:hypothetical protein
MCLLLAQVSELNRMLKAWDEMRQAQDVQIAGLVTRAARAEARSSR